MTVAKLDSAIAALHKRYLEACADYNLEQARYYMNARDAKLQERWSLTQEE